MSAGEEPKVETTVRGALEGFRERKVDVTVTVQDLADVANALGAGTLHDRLQTELVKKLEEDRFHLVVVGEFNHGKTTFVNALLGAAVLPTGVTPTTATIHHLRHATEPSAKVVMESGEERPIPFDGVKAFVVGGENPVDQVSHLEVSYPAPLLEERIVLVDTPGVNDLSLQRADITYSYIPQSDAVLFLLDAGQILKESERAFLQDKVIGQSRDKIVFVITKWDLLNDDEQAEALAYAKKQLGKLVRDPVVFPVSAQMALGGDMDGSGMQKLLEHLATFLAEQRGRILLDNALGEALAASETLIKGVDARRRALTMDEQELARRISAIESDLAGQGATIEERRTKIREDVSAVRAWARRDLDRFVDDATRVITSQLDAADPEDVKTFFQPFLEHVVRTWADAETKEVAAALEGIAERTIALVKEDATATAKRLGDQFGAMPKNKIEIDTLALDMGTYVALSMGIGAIISQAWIFGIMMLVAAPVLGKLAKDRIASEYKRKAKEKTPEILREIASRVGPRIDEMVGEFSTKLDAWVVSASEDLHRELLEVLKSARVARAESKDKGVTEGTAVEAAGEKLGKTRSRLEELRASLWGDAVRAQEGEAKESAMPPVGVNAQGGDA